MAASSSCSSTSTFPSSSSSSRSFSSCAHTRRSLDGLHMTGQGNSTRRRLGPEFGADDISWLSELGRGNGGVVSKTQHKATGFLMASKTFELDIKTSIRAQILRDLQILCECSSPFILEFYGAFYVDTTISICMEYMDAGGLDTLLPIVGRFPEPIVIQIADSVVQGLWYLWQELHIIHRNLKPSNILVSRTGCVKLCDFVVSLQLAEALASAFVCMRTYMAPERLTGELFNSPSDVWSLGLTLMELAIGRYPVPAVDPVDFVQTFAPDLESNMVEHWRAARSGEPLPALEGASREQMSVFDLFTYVVERPAPRLPAYCYSSGFRHLVHSCLQKEPNDRLSIELLRGQILPALLLSTRAQESNAGCTTPVQLSTSSVTSEEPITLSEVSVLNYLRGIFARRQDEAISAVFSAVGADFDVIDEELPDVISSAPPSSSAWNLPSASQRILTASD
ncbi:Dual specificity mitogen-activated protein kinase kinase [Paragonimus heterotremus]|uniref:Dual specificity mitogen-activated protein kinase kinase n=1 Tax=Paragonimus heterotremus TaxID=100268 RepID=A0A8J4TC81_9TREM|nr:Dual specificity mitogen-activated protein kinase kinase [Paragonimus heterotremus]